MLYFNVVKLIFTNKYNINKLFGTGFWLNPAPKDDLIVLQVVTRNIGTLEEVNFTQYFTYHHHPYQYSIYLCIINGIPSPACEIFPGFNFVKINLVTKTQIPGGSDVTPSYGNSGKTVIFPAISPYYLCHTCG